jgi:quercetin dioxygenase-like cupin family protein
MPDTSVALRALVIPPEAGEKLTAFGDTVLVKLTTEQTGGALAVMLSEAPPGGGPPLHRHGHEHEVFYVLEGRMSFFADGVWTEGGPGTLTYLPRGQAHTFKNVGDVPSKMLIITLPSGFEQFFAACATTFNATTPPDMAKIFQAAAQHQIEFLPE